MLELLRGDTFRNLFYQFLRDPNDGIDTIIVASWNFFHRLVF
jgi:hypothetical protein